MEDSSFCNTHSRTHEDWYSSKVWISSMYTDQRHLQMRKNYSQYRAECRQRMYYWRWFCRFAELSSEFDNTQSCQDEFQQQKEAFNDIPSWHLSQYQGEYVVSHNGKIVDHDPDLPTLTQRFFGNHPNKCVYITMVGKSVPESLVTPFY